MKNINKGAVGSRAHVEHEISSFCQDIDKDIQQLFEFFKENVKISKIRRLHEFYKITSDNPAIMLNMFSTIQELIPEVYFKEEDTSVETGETP